MKILKMKDSDLSKLLRDVEEEARRRIVEPKGDVFSQIRSQEAGKRALLIAAVGKHSIHFVGPRGCGKTMLRSAGLSIGVTKSFESHPCPCGYYSDPRKSCECSEEEILKFRLEWPVAEIEVEVTSLSARDMLTTIKGTSLKDVKQQIPSAKPTPSLKLTPESESLLKSAVSEMGLSARNVDQTLRVARSIAWVGWHSEIQVSDIVEAINYQPRR